MACNKEKEIGCTDPSAVNYDPDATSIPGSDIGHCIYDSSCLTLIQNVDINDELLISRWRSFLSLCQMSRSTLLIK